MSPGDKNHIKRLEDRIERVEIMLRLMTPDVDKLLAQSRAIKLRAVRQGKHKLTKCLECGAEPGQSCVDENDNPKGLCAERVTNASTPKATKDAAKAP